MNRTKKIKIDFYINMSKVSNQINNIIRNAGWAKAFADLDDLMKFKKVTGVEWVSNDFLNDADNEPKLLWMIAGGGCFPKIGGDEPVRPDVTPNTPEQNEIQEDVMNRLANGETAITIEGEANNLTIPASVTKNITITGTFQSGATITNLSGKGVTIKSESEEPVNIIIDSQGGTATLKGVYGQVFANTKSVSATGAKIQQVVFDSALEGKGDLSVNADWVEPVLVESYNTNNLSIRNASDTTVLEQVEIIAPNATVTMYGKWGNAVATVGNDTLVLDASFHANKLEVKKGNVLVKNCFPEQCADEIVLAQGCTFGAWRKNVPGESTNLTTNAGIYVISEECTITNGAVFGIIASGNFKYINNAKLTAGNKNGICLTRSGVNVYFEGNGVWENPNGYGIWKSSETGVMQINGGYFKAQTHVVYAEKGVIEINGGEFELINTEDKKFLLNCKDDQYQAGKANIVVKGGKFHDFDPANSMSEVGGPVSFVAEGFKSVQTAENIWEVFAEDAEVEAWVAPVETSETSDETSVDDTSTETPAE